MLESMKNNDVAHNFAARGHQVHFKNADKTKGHVTAWIDETQAAMTDCAAGSKTCERTGDLATHKFPSWVTQ